MKVAEQFLQGGVYEGEAAVLAAEFTIAEEYRYRWRVPEEATQEGAESIEQAGAPMCSIRHKAFLSPA